MARVRLSGAFAGLLITVVLALGPKFAPARAADPVRPRPGQVLLFVVDRASFEDVMSVPEFRQLARAGGAGLMTTRVGEGNRQASAYITIGAGAVLPDGAPSQLMARTLASYGVGTCVQHTGEEVVRLERLIASVPAEATLCSPALHRPPARVAIVGTDVTLRVDRGTGSGTSPAAVRARRAALRSQGRLLSAILGTGAHPMGGRTLALVVTPLPSRAMDAAGDEVTPILMAESPGARDAFFRGNGPLHGLTSDSTRRGGLVSNVDVAPTILSFFGLPIPSEMDGRPIRTTGGPAPFALHRRHLELRRIRIPFQMGEVAVVSIGGMLMVAALLALGRRRRLSERSASVVRFVTLCVTALPLALLAAGSLPHLTYAYAIPFVGATIVVLAALSLTAARSRGPLAPFVFIGFVGLAFVVVDAVRGGPSFGTPLLGGTMFDGARFYGLPNAFIALLLASALFVAIGLEHWAGFVVLFAVGLFAGFPRLGANVGASITLFAAAGLWLAFRKAERLGLKEVALSGGVTATGLAIVLAVNRYLPGTPTHATRFAQRAGGSLSDAWHTVTDRLSTNGHLLATNPAGWIPLAGLVAVLLLTLKAPGPVGWGLRIEPRWRRLIVTVVLASGVAFVVNDTGTTAAAPGFLYAITAMSYPALLRVQGLGRWGESRKEGAQ